MALIIPSRMGSMNFGDSKGKLQGPQISKARLGLLFEIYLRDEELHLLLDIGLQRLGRPARKLVSALLEPGLEAVGLFRAEDEDVVLADGILRLDSDSERLGAGRASDACRPSSLPSEPSPRD